MINPLEKSLTLYLHPGYTVCSHVFLARADWLISRMIQLRTKTLKNHSQHVAIEHGHRNSGFMWIYQLKIVIFHGFLYVYQGVYIYIIGWWCSFTILKNDGVRQWVSDDIPYMMEKRLKPPTR